MSLTMECKRNELRSCGTSKRICTMQWTSMTIPEKSNGNCRRAEEPDTTVSQTDYRWEVLGLTPCELAFNDAVAYNESTRALIAKANLRELAFTSSKPCAAIPLSTGPSKKASCPRQAAGQTRPTQIWLPNRPNVIGYWNGDEAGGVVGCGVGGEIDLVATLSLNRWTVFDLAMWRIFNTKVQYKY